MLTVHPADFGLLGIKFENQFWIDKNLPMGCSISCYLFENFATFLHWLVQKQSGLSSLDHYLDDFIFAGAAHSNNCKYLMDSFQNLCHKISIPLAENKTVGPSTFITFLGLGIDTVNMFVVIPLDKIEKLKSGIHLILSRKKLKVKEFESIVGLMAFCARAIPSARAFMRRFYDVLAVMKVKKSYYQIKMTNSVRTSFSLTSMGRAIFQIQYGSQMISFSCLQTVPTLFLWVLPLSSLDIGSNLNGLFIGSLNSSCLMYHF